ncbi:MAG: CBS domain-containing protein [Methanoregulaceae archaeon]
MTTKQIQVKDVMAKPVTISKAAVITEALDKMLDERIDPLIAMNNHAVAGIVSRKSIAEKLGSKQNAAISPSKIHVATAVAEDFTPVYPDQDVNILVPLLQRFKLVVVYDTDHRLIGQVGAGDLLKLYQPEVALHEVMEKAITIESEERVVHLRRRMIDTGTDRFIVTENEKVVGIVTETDVAIAMRKFREDVDDKHQDHRIRNLLVRDIMSAPLISVAPDAAVGTAVTTMLSKNISSVPVMEKGKVLGIVTRTSLVNAL